MKFLQKSLLVIGLLFAVISAIFFVTQKTDFLQLAPKIAHAQNKQATNEDSAKQLNDLHSALTAATAGPDSKWLFGTTGVWSICLGLANAFVAVILFFFAFVNIAHIQYDTYQLKKTMPGLIIGIILANFSLVISRMIVDVAQVLTATFLQHPDTTFTNLLCGFAIKTNQSTAASLVALSGYFSVIVIIVFGLAILIALLILSFLLWIRKIIIILLVAVSPIAFILLAFPPTEAYFKQWWSYFMNWVFMGPIVMFIVWVASMIGASNCGTFSISAMFAVCALLYACAIVPFKLGGAVMSGWGKLGAGAAKLGGNAAYNNPWAKGARMKGARNFQNLQHNTKFGRAFLGGAIAGSIDRAKEKEKYYTGKLEEDTAVRSGRAADQFHTKEKRISNVEETVRRQIGQTRMKELSDLDMSTKADLAEGARRLAHNGDQTGYNALMEKAAGDAMVADVIAEASREGNEEIKKVLTEKYKIPVDFDWDDQSIENQKKFIQMTVKNDKGGEDLRAEARVQEAWVKSGIANGSDIISDSSAKDGSGRRRLKISGPDAVAADIDKYDRQTMGRFQSPDANKAMRNLRKETFFDKDNNLTEEGMRLMKKGMLTDEHIRMLSRSRASMMGKFNQQGNIERLEANGDPNLLKVANKLRGMGYGSTSAPNQVIVRDQNGHIGATEISQVNAEHLAANPDIAKRISEKFNDNPAMNAAEAENIAIQVEGNTAFKPEYKVHIRGVAELKKAEINARGLNNPEIDATTTEALMNQTAKTIQDQIGGSLQNGIDIAPIINRVTGQVKGPAQGVLKQKIKEAIASSQDPVIWTPQGTALSAADIVAAHKASKTSGEDAGLNFINQLQILSGGQALSSADMERAQRLVDAYEFKPVAKPSAKNSREQYENIVAQQAADEAEFYDENP